MWGLRHRTSRRWLTKSGSESPYETLAQDFPTKGEADEHRKTLESFADAWQAVELGVTRDGEGTVTQRTAAWAMVEDAQERLNTAAAGHLKTECDRYHEARIVWQSKPRGSQESADAWRTVQVEQYALNVAAAHHPELRIRTNELRAALDEYVRIGGSEKRQPGVGGLS